VGWPWPPGRCASYATVCTGKNKQASLQISRSWAQYAKWIHLRVSGEQWGSAMQTPCCGFRQHSSHTLILGLERTLKLMLLSPRWFKGYFFCILSTIRVCPPSFPTKLPLCNHLLGLRLSVIIICALSLLRLAQRAARMTAIAAMNMVYENISPCVK
jgi:hypothetical protein